MSSDYSGCWLEAVRMASAVGDKENSKAPKAPSSPSWWYFGTQEGPKVI